MPANAYTGMPTMTAYRLLGWGRGGYAEVDVPVLRHDEVLVRVAGAGLCHSDLGFLAMGPGEWPARPPWTLGHENAGWVDECGPDVEKLSPGDSVLASGIHSCGRCEFCLRGADNYCRVARTGRGAGLDGGLAPFVVVPERELVPLASPHPRDFAPLADAGHTSYGAVKRVLPKLAPGSTALVIGAGGLGGYAIQYLRLLSATRVVAVDTAPNRREYALELGAHDVLDSDESTVDAVRELTHGRGAQAVLDFVGSEQTLGVALACAAELGSVALIGMGSGNVPFRWGRTPPLGCEVFYCIGGSLTELHEVVALAERGSLQIDVDVFPFDEIEIALERLERHELRGRAVVTPNGE
jgi:alcohol dehydrogenase, propanol-preferring